MAALRAARATGLATGGFAGLSPQPGGPRATSPEAGTR
jgi:hypothetical protein